MKKRYRKPEVVFEDFRLMEAIASSCSVEAQHDNKYTCSWRNDSFGLNIYETSMVSSCEDDGIAINVPEDILFSS